MRYAVNAVLSALVVASALFLGNVQGDLLELGRPRTADNPLKARAVHNLHHDSLHTDSIVKRETKRARLNRSICQGLQGSFDSNLVAKVKGNLAATASDSWVSGTQMEALIELDTPKLSVFNRKYHKNARRAKVINDEVSGIAKYWLDTLPPDAKSMVNDGGAVGDTASVGVGFVNAGFSSQSAVDRRRFRTYAAREIDWLLLEGKRMSNGALSHRPAWEPAQAWDDFVYMVPPFLAYWGSVNNNLTIVLQAYEQIKLYRDIMHDPATNMWRHVTNNGEWTDENCWGTGMAWAAAGITRVYATMRFSIYAKESKEELEDLAAWANEIIGATFAHQNTSSGLLPNAYNSGANSKWDEAASTALFAATAFRMAQMGILKNQISVIAKAEFMRKGIRNQLNQESGWMYTVNPLDWYVVTDKSPESMAFVLLLEAAARDYRSAIDCKV